MDDVLERSSGRRGAPRLRAVMADGRVGEAITRNHAFHADRRKDQRLMRAGYRVVRFTWWQVLHAPGEVVETLRVLTAA